MSDFLNQLGNASYESYMETYYVDLLLDDPEGPDYSPEQLTKIYRLNNDAKLVLDIINMYIDDIENNILVITDSLWNETIKPLIMRMNIASSSAYRMAINGGKKI